MCKYKDEEERISDGGGCLFIVIVMMIVMILAKLLIWGKNDSKMSKMLLRRCWENLWKLWKALPL